MALKLVSEFATCVTRPVKTVIDGIFDMSDLTVIEYRRQQDASHRLCQNWERRLAV